MKRLALFFLPGLLIVAGMQLHQQHSSGAGWQPQQQAASVAADWITRTITR